jgi:hypothetical protein
MQSGLRHAQQKFDRPIGSALLHQRSLVPVSLPDLQRQKDKRDENSGSADEATDRCKVGKTHLGSPG